MEDIDHIEAIKSHLDQAKSDLKILKTVREKAGKLLKNICDTATKTAIEKQKNNVFDGMTENDKYISKYIYNYNKPPTINVLNLKNLSDSIKSGYKNYGSHNIDERKEFVKNFINYALKSSSLRNKITDNTKVKFCNDCDGADGYYNETTNEININENNLMDLDEGTSDKMTNTIVEEISHVLINNNKYGAFKTKKDNDTAKLLSNAACVYANNLQDSHLYDSNPNEEVAKNNASNWERYITNHNDITDYTSFGHINNYIQTTKNAKIFAERYIRKAIDYLKNKKNRFKK